MIKKILNLRLMDIPVYPYFLWVLLQGLAFNRFEGYEWEVGIVSICFLMWMEMGVYNDD